jgi:hypothetical protein
LICFCCYWTQIDFCNFFWANDEFVLTFDGGNGTDSGPEWQSTDFAVSALTAALALDDDSSRENLLAMKFAAAAGALFFATDRFAGLVCPRRRK